MCPSQKVQILAAIVAHCLAGEQAVASSDLFYELTRTGVVAHENELEMCLVELRRQGLLTLIAVATSAEVAAYGRFFITNVAIEAFATILPEIPSATRSVLMQYVR